MIQLIPVTSTNIEAMGYDEAAGEMYVQFKSSPAVYVYPGVPKQVYEDVRAGNSIGVAFDAEIKKKVDKLLVRKEQCG